MPPKFSLKSTGPGEASLSVSDLALPPKGPGPEFAIQRATDDRYLGADHTWCDQPQWHRLEPDPGAPTTSFRAGPDLVDPLAELSGRDTFRTLVRWSDGRADGGLRITGELIGSAARQRAEPPPRPAITTPPPPAARAPSRPPAVPNPAPPPPKRGLLWALAIGLPLVVLAAAGLWWFGRGSPSHEERTARQEEPTPPVPRAADSRAAPPAADQADRTDAAGPKAAPGAEKDPRTAAARTDAAPDTAAGREQEPRGIAVVPPIETPRDAPAPPGTAGEPPETVVLKVPLPSQYEAPERKGRDYVGWLRDQQPEPAVYKAAAERRAQEGDCGAVVLLYDQAAKSSPEVAAEVARLYDPEGFRPTTCIEQPSETNAREYYELAAAGGITDAARRIEQRPGQAPGPVPANRTWENPGTAPGGNRR